MTFMFEMGSELSIRDPQTSKSLWWKGLHEWYGQSLLGLTLRAYYNLCQKSVLLLQAIIKGNKMLSSYFSFKNVFVDTRHTWISCCNIVPFRHFMVSLPSHGEKRGQKEAWGTLTMLLSKHNLANARLYCISNIGY